MKKLKTSFPHRIFKILKWGFLILLGIFLVAELIRLPFRLKEEETERQVARIHATKLELADVTGENLPPDPGPEADKTIAGIDANQNGIRDDVELAIFREYPDSAKTRAVLLQYALALQMEFTQPVVNEEVVIAVAQEGSRGYLCVGEILNRDDDDEKVMNKYFENGDKLRSFIERKQLSTRERVSFQQNFYEKIGSYKSLDRYCDIDYSKLPN